jgi:hypothetical protein
MNMSDPGFSIENLFGALGKFLDRYSAHFQLFFGTQKYCSITKCYSQVFPVLTGIKIFDLQKSDYLAGLRLNLNN